jgi:predicted nucleic acid-binding protein
VRRYWDSAAFLAWLQNEAGRVDSCHDTLEEAKQGSFIIMTSALTLTEALWLRNGPKLGEYKARLLNRFFRRSFLRIVNVDRSIAESAQRLVWQDDIKPKDAIHVATALRYKCTLLETFDEPLIGKSGLQGLTIRKPQRRAQGSLLLQTPGGKDG